LQLRQQRFNSINDLNDVCAGLSLNVDDDRRHVVHPRCLLHVLRAVYNSGHIRQNNRRAVSISNDNLAVIFIGKDLIIGVDLVRLLWSIKISFRLVDTRLL